VVDRGAFTQGLHRNLGGPRVSTRERAGGVRLTNPQADTQGHAVRVGAKDRVARVEPTPEGDQGDRGRRESEDPMTSDAG